jgi:hypothetical protein
VNAITTRSGRTTGERDEMEKETENGKAGKKLECDASPSMRRIGASERESMLEKDLDATHHPEMRRTQETECQKGVNEGSGCDASHPMRRIAPDGDYGEFVDVEIEELDEPEDNKKVPEVLETSKTVLHPEIKAYKPRIPYPQRLRKEKMKESYGKFCDLIKNVNVNVPLVDLISGMPDYSKFMKELVSNKKKMEEVQAAVLNTECSSVIQNGKLPPKLTDPGSFLLTCNFDKTYSCNALADLGASINLMPYSLYAKLALNSLKPTRMSIRLADRSLQYPLGIAENMLVQVGKFVFPVDFVILEMEEDSKVPLILGRPFLNTADAIIRVKNKEISLGIGDDRMVFNVEKSMKHSYSNKKDCFSIDVIDDDLDAGLDGVVESDEDWFEELDELIMKEDLAELEEKSDDVDGMTMEEFGKWLENGLDGLETVSPIEVDVEFDFEEDMEFFEALDREVCGKKDDELEVEKKPPDLSEPQLQGIYDFIEKLISYLNCRKDESLAKVGLASFRDREKKCKNFCIYFEYLKTFIIFVNSRQWCDAWFNYFYGLFVSNEAIMLYDYFCLFVGELGRT